jgi:acylphosphatase
VKFRLHVTVRGRVQGVAFRYYTRRRALELGVYGWVRNMPDGSVEALLEGEQSAVQAIVEWCRTGPPAARVERIDIREEESDGEFGDFSITF